ncbi:M6 family metalloprotease domain-containing protein [bacterium]|nr:M6 family metalloprotease domain-containing protein [bacterium]
MANYIYFITVFFFLIGCSSSEKTSQDDGPAEVPHAKSSIPMLGILIGYNNIKVASSDGVWSTKLFGKNLHELNHYYIEVSNSNFEFEKVAETNGVANDGIVRVVLNKNHPDTDINSLLFESNVYPDLKAALEQVDDDIDFSNYDTDANGYITPDELLLTFIIAGYEDAYEGYHVQNGIWAHQYCMTSSSNIPTLDAVTLMACSKEGNFALFGEKHDNDFRYTHDATIGIIAHELGHSAFNLPDLYNTTGDYGGIGYFGLMGAGTWAMQSSDAFPGNTPSHLSAWSKVYNGWVTPTQETGTSTLNETSSSNYNVIKIPIDATNYYLLENRNNSGYDRGLFSLTGTFDGGMALWRINEAKLSTYYIESNLVNADTNNKGVDLVEAANATLDTTAFAPGDEKALFYYENVASFETLITDVSSRGSQMTLNIK